MSAPTLLIANRGEVAIRISRAARALGWRTVTVFSEDDADSLHRRHTDRAVALTGVGPQAYMDMDQLLAVAHTEGCDWLHPGIGFLSERGVLARRCADAGVGFVGPAADVLEVFGDKVRARALAASAGLPLLESVPVDPVSSEPAQAFVERLAASGHKAVIKAVAGGGGRGMRVVQDTASLEAALPSCRAEALNAFGDGSLYLERFIPQARHVEVQLLGDGTRVTHLWTRNCSLQRRFQKLVEIAPAPWLSDALRAQLLDAGLALGTAQPFGGLITAEFLVDGDDQPVFIEANARLQVEHTVTEEVTGVDLVRTQLQVAAGASLDELGLAEPPPAMGYALQCRVNTEEIHGADWRPTSGTLTGFTLPSGPGVRVDTAGYVGLTPSLAFDSLLAKVIVHARGRYASGTSVLSAAYRALCDTHIAGIGTNLDLLRALTSHPEVEAGGATTTFVDEQLASLSQPRQHPLSHALTAASSPLAEKPPETTWEVDEALVAPVDGTVARCEVEVGDRVAPGQALVVMSAMKMEYVLTAERSATVSEVRVAVGATVRQGTALLLFVDADASDAGPSAGHDVDLDVIRLDLAALKDRKARTLDAARPDAVAKRHARGGRTARENLNDLCDPGSFVEYGGLALASQRAGKKLDTLIAKTPADGIIVGVANVNGDLFGAPAARCAVMAYDYTVFAGTQGHQGHRKTDRVIAVAEEAGLPVIFFTEGGGGRPNDTDLINVVITGLECSTFRGLAALQGKVPLIGVNHGRCFAGNAALLGCCDIIIATRDSNIGMGGPAMIEGGGLGVFSPDDVGPIQDMVASGVVDLVVDDEAAAVAAAKRTLTYFQGALTTWEAPDPRLLRHVVPEHRLRVYDVRHAIAALVDEGSTLELQPEFTPGMITALARIEGRPVGIIANNPAVLAGAIDTACARKACRMMRLCDQHGVPVLLLCDTPGFMVGPEAERTGTVRAAAEMFTTAAKLSVPLGTIVLRKGYGLGAQAMAGGHFKAPRFLVSWPTGEFGPMGLEGAVRLGFRRQLEAIAAPDKRQALFEQLVDTLYERGQALNVASHFEVDDVIDPADSRDWVRLLF